MDAERLLDELCVELGLCLPPDDKQQLIELPPLTVDAFADEVLLREGLDPVMCDSDLRRAARGVVARHMGQPLSPGERRRGQRM